MSKIFITALISTVALAMPMVAQAQSDPVAPTTVVTAAQRYPISVFGLQPFMSGPRISPDGTKIVVSLSRSGKKVLGIIDLTKPGSAPEYILSATEVREVGDRTVQGYNWVGDENIIITLQSREDIFGQRGDVYRLVAYNLKTKAKTPLAWDGALFDAANVLDIDHDKGSILLERQSNAYGTELFRNPEVVRVDVRTGKYTVVQRPNPIVFGWFTDSDGVIRGASAGDDSTDKSGKERMLYRSTASDTFKTVLN